MVLGCLSLKVPNFNLKYLFFKRQNMVVTATTACKSFGKGGTFDSNRVLRYKFDISHAMFLKFL